VGQRQTRGAPLQLTEQEQVDVDQPRTVADTVAGAAEVALERLAGLQQRGRLKRRLDCKAGVEEGRLVEDLADRVGVVDAGGCQYPNAAREQPVERRLARRSPTLESRPR
jgi:hypothetical protein